MQPNELRIGNFVDTAHGIGVVTELHANNIREFRIGVTVPPMHRYVFSNANPTPIPLTAEILEKCGFVFDGKSYVINKDKYHTFSILFNKICYPCIRNNHHEICEHFSLYGIKHLHQLQNLYFTLTGEELEIKI